MDSHGQTDKWTKAVEMADQLHETVHRQPVASMKLPGNVVFADLPVKTAVDIARVRCILDYTAHYTEPLDLENCLVLYRAGRLDELPEVMKPELPITPNMKMAMSIVPRPDGGHTVINMIDFSTRTLVCRSSCVSLSCNHPVCRYCAIIQCVVIVQSSSVSLACNDPVCRCPVFI